MENHIFGEGEPITEEDDSPEKAFLEGFEEDEKIEECAECGSAVNEENKVIRDIEGEKHIFCSKLCAEEFEENL